MIRPRPKPSADKQRGAAIGVTVLLMLTAQASLKGIPVPAFASGRDVIRELDPLMLERFATPPPEELDDVTEESVAEDAPDEPLETVSFEQEVGLAMEQLERAFGSDEGAGRQD